MAYRRQWRCSLLECHRSFKVPLHERAGSRQVCRNPRAVRESPLASPLTSLQDLMKVRCASRDPISDVYETGPDAWRSGDASQNQAPRR